jgi:hypothetical protein
LPRILHWISGKSFRLVKHSVEGITKIGPAFGASIASCAIVILVMLSTSRTLPYTSLLVQKKLKFWVTLTESLLCMSNYMTETVWTDGRQTVLSCSLLFFLQVCQNRFDRS